MEGCDMDFSDIRTIIIGEAGEYGKRLVRYLEIHLSSAVRVYHFTTAEGMVSFKEEAEIYLLDERFFKELSEEKQKFLKQKKLILLTWREEQGSFCKYDNPQKLLDMLSDFTDYNSDLSDLAAELKDTPTKLTIVYSPVYDEYLEQIARSFMSLGDVYMGAEDLGYKGIDSEYGEGGDMGDLCYYIHLREENILDILQDMLIPKEEVQVLHSPDLYFYLRELTKEDYAWFFDKIKKESPYREVFWGAGNCFVANVDTESEEQIRQRKEQFLKKQKKIILIEIIAGAVFLAFLIIRAAFLQDDILLSRNSFGQGSKEVQLSLKKDDKKKEITYKLDEQKLSAEEESKVYIQFFKKLKKIMMKNNTSLKQIQTPLNLPDTVDGYPFEITYELAEDGYIRLDGSINEEEQAKLKRGETYRTYIVVTARYGEYRKSKKYEIRIVPKKNISQTNVFYKIQQYLKKEEQENRYSRDIKIPSVYKDIEITKRQENQGGISGILILFVTVCIFIPLHNYLKLQEEGKKCQEQAERDFPVIVHLLTLYMGAGLSFFSAVKRISQNYQKQRELDDSKKYAFEKMMRMEQQMSNGVSQREACQDWGMQFRTDSYQKLSLILIQSFTKGGREAAMLMEAEEREAFHKRIDRAKKEGEEASTRLLFPMILLLCQVMLLVMYPALTRFQGF